MHISRFVRPQGSIRLPHRSGSPDVESDNFLINDGHYTLITTIHTCKDNYIVRSVTASVSYWSKVGGASMGADANTLIAKCY